ncbi:replication factor C subunit 1 isoform X2 [Zootermopsis nevadensis]|uniref:replication factor C subunit 1 isoform X2 n=1 Tax=Zootermopsis nevadensis TaxID=136037 RepID=UPI000B8EC9F5|nr:replication factor C subunit 1 isoform X2 [Zootermopsis nevadensis]
MSHDIRSYFLPTAGNGKKDKNKREVKRKRQVLDSDSEEEFLPTKVKNHKGNCDFSGSCARNGKEKNDKYSCKSELKPVDVGDVFGYSQVKRTLSRKCAEKNKVMEDVKPKLENQHANSDFEATLQELNEQKLVCKKEKEKAHKKEKEKDGLHTSELSESVVVLYNMPRNVTEERQSKNDKELLNDKKENKEKEATRLSSQARTSSDLPKKNKKCIDVNQHVRNEGNNKQEDVRSLLPADSSSSDDVFERKKQHAAQYQRYLQREGPKNPGGKAVPQGKPGCLSGLVFVVSGVLETIDREQVTALVKQCGGRVTSSVSRNTSYLVVGDEPGPAKIEKAIKLNTTQLTEDGLFDLIRTKSGPPDSSEMLRKKLKKHIDKDDEIKRNEKWSIPSPAESGDSTFHQHSLWADKYKPLSTKQIIGQQGDRSNVKKLVSWLQGWHSNHSGKKKLVRPSPWAKDDTGNFFKAALLSGPPGVGKTTTVHLVCKELGFDIVEFNASDTRSKKLLHEEVSELLSNKSLSGYFQGAAARKPTENHVLVMDEVDGMAGNEDRGGMQELIQLIKSCRVPVICMCNDRHHQKIRSLTNYCFDLQFSRPRVEQIRGAMMSICYKEGIKIHPEALNDIITGANHDIRQVLHHLSMWSVKDKHLSTERAKEESHKAKKDIKLGPWDVLKKVFSADAHKTMSIHDKSDLFFHDYSLGPLFVQENYLSVMPHKVRGNRKRHLELVAQTAESLSTGDIVEKSIRSRNAWSLLPTQAMLSSVLPGHIMEGHLTSQISFPAWLGKNSRRSKFERLLQELHMHMRLSISGSKEAVNLDYLTHLRDSVVSPLINNGLDGVAATIHIMQNYYLLREDIDSLMEISLWPNQKDPLSCVNSKVKAAFTRTVNKEGIMTPYSVINIKKSASKFNQDSDIVGDGQDDENGDEVEEDEEDITKDAMIKKAKKRPAAVNDHAPGGSGSKRQKVVGKGIKKKCDMGKGK